MDWDAMLISIQVNKELEKQKAIINAGLRKLEQSNNITPKCMDCPAPAAFYLNDIPYCSSCFAEHTGLVGE